MEGSPSTLKNEKYILDSTIVTAQNYSNFGPFFGLYNELIYENIKQKQKINLI